MFEIGGWEFLVIIVAAILVIGPKDLPAAIRTVTGWIRRARELARDFQSGLDDLAREAELDEMQNQIQSGLGLDDVAEAGESLRRDIAHSIDPGGEIAGAFEDDPAGLAPDQPLPHRRDSAREPEAAKHASELPSADAPDAAGQEPAGAAKKV